MCSSSTLVTAYYDIPAKHSSEQYRSWMAQVLATGSPMVIYCDAASQPLVQHLRPDSLPTRYEVVPLDTFSWMQPYDAAFWAQQQQCDPERHSSHRHVSHELYQIWDSKLEMVHRAAQHNSFQSRHFWWVDIGSLRQGERFPGAWPGHLPSDLGPDQVVVANPWEDVIQGGFFGGSTAALRWYHDHFYAELASWAQQGRFIGKDQLLMTTLVRRHPEHFHVLDVQSQDGPGHHWDPWFRFWPVLASSTSLEPCSTQAVPTGISLVIPCVPAHVQYLPECVASALAQTRPPQEVVIALSACTPSEAHEAEAAVRAIAGANPMAIRMLAQGEPAAAATNRNRGARASSQPIVSFIDADDTMHPQRLERVLGLLHEHRADAVLHGFAPNSPCEAWPVGSGHVIAPEEAAMREAADRESVHLTFLLVTHGHITVRRSVLEAVQQDPSAAGREDSLFVRQVFAAGFRVAMTDDRLSTYWQERSTAAGTPS